MPVSSTELFILWQPPQQHEQNGIITGYQILISPSNTSSQTRTYTVPADINSLRVTGDAISRPVLGTYMCVDL